MGEIDASPGSALDLVKALAERHYRDVLCSRVHTRQDDSIVAAAGRAAFGG